MVVLNCLCLTVQNFWIKYYLEVWNTARGADIRSQWTQLKCVFNNIRIPIGTAAVQQTSRFLVDIQLICTFFNILCYPDITKKIRVLISFSHISFIRVCILLICDIAVRIIVLILLIRISTSCLCIRQLHTISNFIIGTVKVIRTGTIGRIHKVLHKDCPGKYRMSCVILYLRGSIIPHRGRFFWIFFYTSVQCNIGKWKSQLGCCLVTDGADQTGCSIRSFFILTFSCHIFLTGGELIYGQFCCFCNSIDQKWRIGGIIAFFHSCHSDSIQCHIFQIDSNNVADRISDDTSINQCTGIILCTVVWTVCIFFTFKFFFSYHTRKRSLIYQHTMRSVIEQSVLHQVMLMFCIRERFICFFYRIHRIVGKGQVCIWTSITFRANMYRGKRCHRIIRISIQIQVSGYACHKRIIWCTGDFFPEPRSDIFCSILGCTPQN